MATGSSVGKARITLKNIFHIIKFVFSFDQLALIASASRSSGALYLLIIFQSLHILTLSPLADFDVLSTGKGRKNYFGVTGLTISYTFDSFRKWKT